jgi:hypothetical protein
MRYHLRGETRSGTAIERDAELPDDVRQGMAIEVDGEQLEVREVRTKPGDDFATVILGPGPPPVSDT